MDRLYVKIDNLNNPLMGFFFKRSTRRIPALCSGNFFNISELAVGEM
jgi:hypothetical protein